jgi:hypothetical protein
MDTMTFKIAKSPFAIDYLMDSDNNENDQKTIEILYDLQDENQKKVGILRVLNRIINSVADRKFYEWIDSSVEIEQGYIHFLSRELTLKQNQWEKLNNEQLIIYDGTGFGSLNGNHYLIEVHFEHGFAYKMKITPK